MFAPFYGKVLGCSFPKSFGFSRNFLTLYSWDSLQHLWFHSFPGSFNSFGDVWSDFPLKGNDKLRFHAKQNSIVNWKTHIDQPKNNTGEIPMAIIMLSCSFSYHYEQLRQKIIFPFSFAFGGCAQLFILMYGDLLKDFI